jgi:hypothetical protein
MMNAAEAIASLLIPRGIPISLFVLCTRRSVVDSSFIGDAAGLNTICRWPATKSPCGGAAEAASLVVNSEG